MTHGIRFISQKQSHFIACLVLFVSFVSLPSATSATPITDFDGAYKGKFTVTVTVTVPTNPPKKFSNTQTVDMQLAVHNGQIIGWGKGTVISKTGKATMTVPITGYGNITFTAYFSRNTSTSVTTLTGLLSGSFPSVRAVVSGRFSATGGEKFAFTISSALKNAQIGKKYPGASFCQPEVKPGGLCGTFPKSTNPSGGKPPYSFRLKVGSDFLPTGMILNFRTGQISGTPIAGQKPGTKQLVVCAYDSNDAFTGVCRTTSLTLMQ